MSRASISSQRNLTLTEELEKLEQSITLTLQGPCPLNQYLLMPCLSPADLEIEIDHNFSRAHRIVTTSILPIVEQYAENSKNVWEGSKVRIDPMFTSTTSDRSYTVLEAVLRSVGQRLSLRIRRKTRRRRDGDRRHYKPNHPILCILRFPGSAR